MELLITDKLVYSLAIKTTDILTLKQKELQETKWHDGESNTDSEYSSLACKCCLQAWEIIKAKRKALKDVVLICVIPDINLTFTDKNRCIIKKKIELKSSTSRRMPGSTIRALDINLPLIYCLRPATRSGHYQVRCCQYYEAMGETAYDLFQDRTPRPVLNFEKMSSIKSDDEYKKVSKFEWVKHYSECAINRVQKKTYKSWQDELVRNIQEITVNNFVKETTLEEFIRLKNMYG